jgi:hypothetical protein
MKKNEKLLSGTANDCYEDAVRYALVHRFADARDSRARARPFADVMCERLVRCLKANEIIRRSGLSCTI